jgi:hypothetical protein
MGVISDGEILFQIEGQSIQSLKQGDAFYEPTKARIAKLNHEGKNPTKFTFFYLHSDKKHETIRILNKWPCHKKIDNAAPTIHPSIRSVATPYRPRLSNGVSLRSLTCTTITPFTTLFTKQLGEKVGLAGVAKHELPLGLLR